MGREAQKPKKKVTSLQLKSWVWKYFNRDEHNEDLVTCKRCDFTYLNKNRDGCTNSMAYHLKKAHQTTKAQHQQEEEETNSNSSTSVTSNASASFSRPGAATWNKKGLPELLCMALIEDKISFNVIRKSRFFKAAFNSMGLPAYTSHDAIKKCAFGFLDKCKAQVKEKIKLNSALGLKYSVIADEYTSVNSRRYMSICLATATTTIGLGLVRCRGSITAVRTVELIKERLLLYGIDIEDLAGFCSDGAAVMQLAGRLMKIPHQVCLGNYHWFMKYKI